MTSLEVSERKRHSFNKMVDFWVNKIAKQGDGYVGRMGESHDTQKRAIEDLIKTKIATESFYSDALDFGSGWGRFSEFLSNFCGHIWAVDLLDELVQRAATMSPVVTPHVLKYPPALPLNKPKFDLLWSCLVFQHITDDGLFIDIAKEIRRVLKPGCRVLILDNAKDHAFHVKPRDPELFAELFGLKTGWTVAGVTINKRPQDHHFIDGIVA